MWKKAQITMETILIYGIIAIVVLSGIGALIYFGVFDLGNYLPDRCSISTGDLECYQWTAEEGSNIAFGFQNNLNRKVTIHNVSLRQTEGIDIFSGSTDGTCVITCNQTSNVNDANPKNQAPCQATAANECTIDTLKGQKVKFDMLVTYQPTGGAINQTASGEFTVKVQ